MFHFAIVFQPRPVDAGHQFGHSFKNIFFLSGEPCLGADSSGLGKFSKGRPPNNLGVPNYDGQHLEDITGICY